jgi:hypothetical protein
MIEISHGPIAKAGDVDTPARAMVNLTAPLTIRANHVMLLHDDDFPVVELAAQLGSWLEREEMTEFRFRSMESEYDDLLVIGVAPGRRYLLSSRWQTAPAPSLDESSVRRAATAYVESVGHAAAKFGVNLQRVVSELRRDTP